MHIVRLFIFRCVSWQWQPLVATDTGATCQHVGYDDFEPDKWDSDCAPNKDDLIKTDLPLCGEDGTYPEEFWSCSDITIEAKGESLNNESKGINKPG